MKFADWLPEWLNKYIYQRKLDEAFVVIALLENQRRLNLEELAVLAEQREEQVRKSLEFLYSEGLVSGNWHMLPKYRHEERYLLTREGHQVFRGKVAAPSGPSSEGSSK